LEAKSVGEDGEEGTLETLGVLEESWSYLRKFGDAFGRETLEKLGAILREKWDSTVFFSLFYAIITYKGIDHKGAC